MTVLRFPSRRREPVAAPDAEDAARLTEIAKALSQLTVMLEWADDLAPLFRDPKTLDDIDTIVAILEVERDPC